MTSGPGTPRMLPRAQDRTSWPRRTLSAGRPVSESCRQSLLVGLLTLAMIARQQAVERRQHEHGQHGTDTQTGRKGQTDREADSSRPDPRRSA